MSDDRAALEMEVKSLREELEIFRWGAARTNDGLRALYHELEIRTRELQKLDDLKSEFVSTASHELRTPLSIIREGVCIVLDGIAGPLNEKQMALLGKARQHVDRMARLINDLLDMSKIEAGRMALYPKEIEIDGVIEEAINSFKLQADAKGIALKYLPQSRGLKINADRDRLMQVIVNLIGNSFKFTQTGSIEVAFIVRGETIEFSVYDTGCGIDAEDLENIFLKFRQLGNSSGRGGTGLGLSISREIVRLHGGEMWVESELGSYSRFIFSLPMKGVTVE